MAISWLGGEGNKRQTHTERPVWEWRWQEPLRIWPCNLLSPAKHHLPKYPHQLRTQHSNYKYVGDISQPDHDKVNTPCARTSAWMPVLFPGSGFCDSIWESVSCYGEDSSLVRSWWTSNQSAEVSKHLCEPCLWCLQLCTACDSEQLVYLGT